MQHVFASGKGGDQHNQRALGQMEICDQRVHRLEAVAGIDEDIRPAGALGEAAVLGCKGFDRAAGGGSDADDPSALPPGAVEQIGGLLREHAELRMHLMVRDLLGLDRAEGAEADVEGHPGQIHALVPELLQELRRKVQTGGRRGGGAVDAGIDGLIPFLILQLLLDIGGQGHLSKLAQDLQEDALIAEADLFLAVVQGFHDLGGELSVAEAELRADRGLPARARQAFPDVAAGILEQKDLHSPAAGNAVAHQTGRKDAGIVQNQRVAGLEIVDHVVKMPVLDLSALPAENQQSGAVALLKRRLRDQLRRKLIVKIMGFQISILFRRQAAIFCFVYYTWIPAIRQAA